MLDCWCCLRSLFVCLCLSACTRTRKRSLCVSGKRVSRTTTGRNEPMDGEVCWASAGHSARWWCRSPSGCVWCGVVWLCVLHTAQGRAALRPRLLPLFSTRLVSPLGAMESVRAPEIYTAQHSLFSRKHTHKPNQTKPPNNPTYLQPRFLPASRPCWL